MREFSDLYQRAVTLSQRVVTSGPSQYGCYSILGMFSQSLNNKVMKYAHDISSLAQFINRLEAIDDSTKSKLLIGYYSYIWYRFDTELLKMTHADLIAKFQEDLQVQSLQDLDPELYHGALEELDRFCSRHHSELGGLLPGDIMADLRFMLTHQADNSAKWSKNIYDLMGAVGLHG